MIKIAFIKTNFYLPEINAYANYLKKVKNIDSEILTNTKDVDNNHSHIWFFMGLNFKKYKQNVIHEYNSLSIPPFTETKNFIKKTFNKKPYFRVFLNKNIKNRLDFNDKTPFFIKDMGVDEVFYTKENRKKIYDFVYCGLLFKRKLIKKFFYEYKNSKYPYKLVIIGDVDKTFLNDFKKDKRFTFTGRLKSSEIAKIFCNSSYGLNIIENVYPFNIQTSTKVLEYLASGLKVVSTRYEWIDKFFHNKKTEYIRVDSNNLLGFIKNLSNNKIKPVNMLDHQWNNVIRKSKVFSLIK